MRTSSNGREMIPLSLTVVHLMYRIDFAAGERGRDVTCVEIYFSSISALPPYGVAQSIRFSCHGRDPYNLEFYSPLYNELYLSLSPFVLIASP